jgi:hypothetical protein
MAYNLIPIHFLKQLCNFDMYLYIIFVIIKLIYNMQSSV